MSAIGRTTLVAALLLATSLVSTHDARAHEIRPALLDVTEAPNGTIHVTWKVPTRGEGALAVTPVFPADWVALGPASERRVPGAWIQYASFRSEDPGEAGPLVGRRLQIDGLSLVQTDVLVRINPADGPSYSTLIKPGRPWLDISGPRSFGQVATTYLSLGVDHILSGIDHLLFVLGLLFIVKRASMLVKTITAFTVAHSITLAIATLGYASAPEAPLNAAIALSILFLGPEVVRSWRGQTSFTIRHPWVVAFAFGLLHGFGFASGLRTIGLPGHEIAGALLFFNVGVEVGQLVFVAGILAMKRAFVVLETRWPRWAELLPGYVVGSLGAFWTIQRTVMMFTGA